MLGIAVELSLIIMYDSHAEEWNRDNPEFESDEIVRPIMLDIVRSLKPTRIIDLGCGEGYFTRKIAREILDLM